MVRNIRDNEALANLQKNSHVNKNWFTVLDASIWPSTAPTISMFPDEIYVIWWVGVPRMHFLPQATPGLSDPWPDAPIPYVLIRRVWRLTNTKNHSEDYKQAQWKVQCQNNYHNFIDGWSNIGTTETEHIQSFNIITLRVFKHSENHFSCKSTKLHE